MFRNMQLFTRQIKIEKDAIAKCSANNHGIAIMSYHIHLKCYINDDDEENDQIESLKCIEI